MPDVLFYYKLHASVTNNSRKCNVNKNTIETNYLSRKRTDSSASASWQGI